MKIKLQVLNVEDSEADSELLLRHLKSGGYDPISKRVETAATMQEALTEQAWDLIISDYSLPAFYAPEALQLLQKNNLDVPFIIVSGTIGEEAAVDCLKAGAHDFVCKDNLSRLIPAVARGLQEAEMRREHRRGQIALQESHERLKLMLEGIVAALSSTAEKRDPYLAGHQKRVATLACTFARELGYNENQIEEIRIAALLHDIGKITVPIEILSKSGSLNQSEMDLIRRHPLAAYEILQEIEFPWLVPQIILQHHERLDGSGYPKGLFGDEILPEARILAVADTVEAMSSHRPYRDCLGLNVAMDEILENIGKFYDPKVADVCLKLFSDKKVSFLCVAEPELNP